MSTEIPIACDLSEAPDTGPQRMAEYQRLFTTAFVGRERTAGGIRFRLRADDGVEAWVRDLAAREKACCPFFDFDVTTADGEVRWDARVVDDDVAREILDEFYRLPETAGDGLAEWERRLVARGLEITTNEAGTVREVRRAGP